jgi:Fe-S cluster assembly protein SufD
MDLKEKLVSSFMAFEEQIDVTSPLHDVRISAIKNFENKGFPTKKEESWKYTSLNAILKNDYSVFPKHENTIEFPAVKKYFLHEIDTYKVIFVDGKFSSFLSATTHDGIDVCLMSSALNKPKYKMIIDEYFNKIASKDAERLKLRKSNDFLITMAFAGCCINKKHKHMFESQWYL